MSEPITHEWRTLVAELNALLKLKTTIIGMKLFERVEDMEAVPRIRRPQAVHTTDQVVSMASRPPGASKVMPKGTPSSVIDAGTASPHRSSRLTKLV